MKSWFALSVLWCLGGFTRDDFMLVHGCPGGTLRLQNMLKIDYPVDVTGGCRVFIEPFYTDGLDWAELSFSTFSLTSGEVAIYDAQSGGNQLWYCIGCSNNLPSPIRSDTGVFYVRISASSAGTNDITLSYFGVNVDSLATQDNGYSDSNIYTYSYFMPFGVVMAPTYGGTDTSPSGTLAYNLDWRWHIKPKASVEKVILMVTDVGLDPDSSDTVTVYDGDSKTDTVLATFTGATTSVNEWVMSTGNQLLVVLDTTSRTSSVTGSFRARYMTRGSSNAVYQGDYSYCGYAGAVDGIVNFRGDSMIITDGSATNSPQKVSDTCRWSISPSIAQSAAYAGSEDKATLVMSMVSMGIASMSVYDGEHGVGATLLWLCSKCTDVVPPPLISTTGYYYMEYSTSSVVTGLGFEAKYFTNWESGMGFGDREVYLRMGTATSVRPPSFNRKYPASLEHVWWIKPNNVVAETSIYIILNRVDLSGRNDNLTIYDGKWSVGDGAGTVLARYTGSSYPAKWIVAPSSTRTLTAHFATDDGTTHNGIGFDLAFFSDSNNYQCGGHVINPGVLSAPSFIFTDGSDSETTLNQGLDCEWLIRPKGSSTSEVSRIDLFFDRMDMAGGTLSVHEGSTAGGPLLWHCDGCAIVPSLISTTNSSLLVKMKTIGTAGFSYGLGFRATYYSVYDGAIGPGDGRVTLIAGAAPLVESPSYSTSNGVLGDMEDRSLPNHLDLEYLIPSKTGRISVSFVDMWFQDSDCGDNVTIYDGVTRSSRVLASYCASTPPMDWVVSNNTAHALLIVLRTDGDGSRVGGFSFSYFSDTAADGCGHLVEPGLMVAPSMTFNDGSFSTSAMRSNEYCEWRIEPQTFDGGEVTLQFNRVALQSANLTVFDTTVDKGASLLWRCDGCSDFPPVLVSNKSLVVVLKTGTSLLGSGFEAHYATTRGLGRGEYRSAPGGRPRTWQGAEGESVLRMPVFSDANVEIPFWHLSVPVANQEQRLSFGAGIGTTCLRSELDDGSVANKQLRSTLAFPRPRICGVYETGGAAASLVTEQSSYFERQRNPRLYWAEKRQPQCSRFQNLSGILNYDRSQSRLDVNETLFASHQDCHWLFTPSQPAKKLVIHFDELQAHEDFYIKVYAGTSSRGQVLLNCQGCDLSGKRVTSTCGSLYVRHERNSTDVIATGSNVTGAVFKAKVFYRKGDPAGLCLDDPLWKPVKKKKETVTPLTIAVWGMLGIMGMIVIGVPLYFLVLRRHLYPNTFEQEEVVKKFRMVSAVQRHPLYTPRLDQMRNYFLGPNECTICYSVEKAFVFDCKHSICFDCTQNYMASALGDASMFPLKCPMHHTGCLVTIGPGVAKRVLSKDEYARFCSFLDRAVLGEGLNCLKCNLFVNLPENASNPMVQCPYCRHRFCHRCKTDWHTGMRCEDRPDQELEEWRKSKGAMKCPGCYKIIEKDDPDTCNHMVHKATDGMPCLRDRTDFCYCCGMEVLPDYPHEELGTGINHFPDGVFNDCRVINDGYAVALMQRTNERAAGRGRGARRGRNRSRLGRRSAPAANAVYPEIELDDLRHYFN